MSLLGTPLIVVLACLAVLAPVGTLLVWSRIRGPQVLRVVSRLALLGVCELTGVVLAAALANDYGQFYSSWADLLGTVGGNYPASVYGANTPTSHRLSTNDIATPLPDLGTMHVDRATAWSPPLKWRTVGKVEQVTITGKQSHLRNTAYVYLPPQYFAPRYAHTRFPAVEVLTGYPGLASNLPFRMDYPQQALALVQAHRAAPAIYVMLSSTVAPPRDTECTDVPGGPQAETYLAAELPSAVDRAVRALPRDWAIVGDSTGGYCAAKIAMYHRSTFAAGVSLSGYYHAVSDWTTGDLWGGSLARRHRNDLEWVLAHRPAPPVSLYLTISKQEHGADGYRDTMRFLRLVRPPMHVTALIAPVGGHNFAAWGRVLPRALEWLSQAQARQGQQLRDAAARCHCAESALPRTQSDG